MGCVAWNLSEDNACGSISHADQRDLFFPVHTALCSYANDAIKQMGNKMVLLGALTNSGLVLSGYPPTPTIDSSQVCVHTCNCSNPLIHRTALEGPNLICRDLITRSVAVREGDELPS